MHEKKIVEAMVDAVRAELEKSGAGRLLGIKIRVGELSGVRPEPVRHYFEELALGTPLEGAQLVIEETGAGVRCMDCGAVTEDTESATMECPSCGATNLERLTGEELEVESIEVD